MLTLKINILIVLFLLVLVRQFSIKRIDPYNIVLRRVSLVKIISCILCDRKKHNCALDMRFHVVDKPCDYLIISYLPLKNKSRSILEVEEKECDRASLEIRRHNGVAMP